MKPGRILIAAVIQVALLAQEGAVPFDIGHMGCGNFTLETGLATLANGYLFGLPWGLLRSWRRQDEEWTGLTALGLLP